MDNPFAQETRATSGWLWQVITGLALVLLLGLHIIAQHFVVKGGLRDFAAVLAYVRNPIFLVLEAAFLLVVTTHAMLGLRAILLDFGVSDRAEKVLSWTLTMIGVLTVGYGLWVTWAVIH